MRKWKSRYSAMAAAAVLALAHSGTSALAQSPEKFYAGKTLTLMHVTGPGGTMDLASLLAIDYMTRYLPEGTEIVLEHRGGGGGIVGTNYAYNAAPQGRHLFFHADPVAGAADLRPSRRGAL